MAEQQQVDSALVRAKAIIDRLWNDGELGTKVRSKAKELYPDITLPEEQMAPEIAPLRAEIATLKDALAQVKTDRDDERKKREESETKKTLEEALTSARQRFNLTDEGFDKMVARMKETGNYSDAEAAAAWVAQQTPPPKPAGPAWAPQSLNLFGSKDHDEKWQLLHRDPIAYQDAELTEFTRDPDKYVRETFGQAA